MNSDQKKLEALYEAIVPNKRNKIFVLLLGDGPGSDPYGFQGAFTNSKPLMNYCKEQGWGRQDIDVMEMDWNGSPDAFVVQVFDEDTQTWQFADIFPTLEGVKEQYDHSDTVHVTKVALNDAGPDLGTKNNGFKRRWVDSLLGPTAGDEHLPEEPAQNMPNYGGKMPHPQQIKSPDDLIKIHGHVVQHDADRPTPYWALWINDWEMLVPEQVYKKFVEVIGNKYWQDGQRHPDFERAAILKKNPQLFQELLALIKSTKTFKPHYTIKQ